MSNIERVENLKQIVGKVRPDFEALAKIHGAVNYAKEASFALQILNDNSFLADVAMKNQDSLKMAVLNVAAVGLSLSPVEKLAYLVPRKGKVCLDISYVGYIKLATDGGSIKWATAEIVMSKDEFVFQGANREPIHKFNPFGDRGEIVGGYCLAKTHDGEFILSHMTGGEILSIRDRSEAYIAKKGPWMTDENEMIKKTLIRRGQKLWPKSNTRDRLAKAIDVSLEDDPVLINATPEPIVNSKELDEVETIRKHLVALSRDETAYIAHLCRTNNREIKKLTDLTALERSQAVIMLEEIIKIVNEKKVKNEIASGNK